MGDVGDAYAAYVAWHWPIASKIRSPCKQRRHTSKVHQRASCWRLRSRSSKNKTVYISTCNTGTTVKLQTLCPVYIGYCTWKFLTHYFDGFVSSKISMFIKWENHELFIIRSIILIICVLPKNLMIDNLSFSYFIDILILKDLNPILRYGTCLDTIIWIKKYLFLIKKDLLIFWICLGKFF